MITSEMKSILTQDKVDLLSKMIVEIKAELEELKKEIKEIINGR